MLKASPAPAQPDSLTSADRSRKAGKLGAEKLTPEEQRRRFIEAAREAGASEDESEFDRALGRLVKSPLDGDPPQG